MPVTPVVQHPDCYSGLHLYVIRLQLEHLRRSHREVFELLRAAGIGVNLHYIPVYLQPYYQRLGFRAGHCPNAENYYSRAISIPMYAQLDAAKQDAVVAALLHRAMQQRSLSMRAYSRIIKVARTISDLSGEDDVGVPAMAEAIQYRLIDSKYWGDAHG